MATTNEIVTPDWDVEHARWQAELRGLTRALGIKALRRERRPKACWNDMLLDMEITSWKSYRSLIFRGFDVRAVGTWAVCNQAVQSVMLGRAFRPLQARGERSWADSIHNYRRSGVRVKNNREDWQLEGATGDGQEASDVMADWASFKKTLAVDDRDFIEALEAGNVEALSAVKSLKRRKKALADEFRAFRAG